MSITIVSEAGYTPGRRIGLCQEEDLGAWHPGWAQQAASDVIENFMFDERNPTVFKVYPPATANCFVEISYVKKPTPCAATTDPIGLLDCYANALLYYMLMRAAQKAQKFDLARDYERQFRESLGVKAINDMRGSPNVRNQGGVPPGAGA